MSETIEMDVDLIIKTLDFDVEMLRKAYKEYIMAYKDYKQKQNNLWLNTDWEDAIGKARPTVDEKKAYISQNSMNEKLIKENCYYNIQYIKYKIDVGQKKLEILSR